ncbi:MAG: 16S rRNA (uracil(1498)-N(3))-methyltransferase [Bdellovibrionales bacterium]|nr:16S rRNA (uracil(1498)-N(3))-methyltransferase [Bdellovibrionales bacterium]
MHRFLVNRLPAPGAPAELEEAEGHHAVKVLRLSPGHRVLALDGRGGAVWAELMPGRKPLRLSYLGPFENAPQRSLAPITVEMAVIKAAPFEWTIEKCVELGVRRFVPLLTAHSVVKTSGKGPEAFQRKWRFIATQALKQCGRLQEMEVAAPIELGSYLAIERATEAVPRVWCDESAAGQAGAVRVSATTFRNTMEGARILIGPEGGWSDSEKLLLSRSEHHPRVSLGPIVLRADTAAIYAVSILQAAWASGQKGP